MEQFDPKTYITREEKYLASMAGNGKPYPVPITRYEHYLAAIADKIAEASSSTAEQWTFELEDGTTVTKNVVVK